MNPFITLFVWALLMASSFVVSGNMVAYASPIATAFFRFVLALVLMVGILLVKMQMNKSVNKAKGVTQLSALFSSQKVWQYAVISGALVGFFIGMFAALESTTPLHTSVRLFWSRIGIIGNTRKRAFCLAQRGLYLSWCFCFVGLSCGVSAKVGASRWCF